MAFSWKVCLLLLWWPLLMSSRQDCKWLPALARRHTVVSSTVLGRYSGKKGPQLFGRGLQVESGATRNDSLALASYSPYSLVVFATVTPALSASHSCLSFSSCVSILSSVWCYLGHLWTSPAVVLHWFRRPVSAAVWPLYKDSTHTKISFCLAYKGFLGTLKTW